MTTVQIQGNQIKNSTIEANKLDLSDDYTFTGDVQVPSSPANNSSAVPKSYVLDLIQGLSYKDPVRVSDQSSISATYNNGAGTLTADSNGAIDIDSISNPAQGDRILIQKFTSTDAVANGIYEITTVGDASNPFVLTRSADMTSSDQFRNATVFVSEGTDADVLFTQQTDNPTIGTDAISFAQISGAAGITAGDGLAKNGNTLSVNVDRGLQIISDNLETRIGDGIEFDTANNNAMRVKLDGSSLSRSASGLSISSGGVDSIHLASNSVTSQKIDSAVAGNGLLGGGGTALSVDSDDGISVGVNGVTVQLDGSTLSKSATGLKVNVIGTSEIQNNAITEAKISSSVAGDGISGGAGSSLAVDLAPSPGLQFSSNKLDMKLVSDGGLQKDANGVSILLDGSTMGLSASGLKVSSIGTTEIQNNAITEAKLNSSVAGQGLAGGSGTALSVDLKPSAPGLEFVSDQLAVKIDATSGLVIDNTSGLQVKLESDGAIDYDATNGGLEVQVDGGTLEIATNQVRVKDNGIVTQKIADDQITLDKLKYRAEFESFAGNGSATTFDLQFAVHSSWVKKVIVYRNGLRLKYVASNPADVDQYSVNGTGGTGGVCRVTIGAAPSSSDSLFIDYVYNVS